MTKVRGAAQFLRCCTLAAAKPGTPTGEKRVPGKMLDGTGGHRGNAVSISTRLAVVKGRRLLIRQAVSPVKRPRHCAAERGQPSNEHDKQDHTESAEDNVLRAVET